MAPSLGLLSRVLLVSVAATFIVSANRTKADEKPLPGSTDVSSRRPAEDARLEQSLDQIVSINFEDVPLSRLPADLKQYHIDAVIDVKAINDAGITLDEQLSGPPAEQISLRSALDSVLRQLDLEMAARDGRLWITHIDAGSNLLQSRVYRVEDLLYADDATSKRDYSSLIELITSTIAPSTWDEVGGPSSIGAYQGTLLVSQTSGVHRQIEFLLSALRQNRTRQQNKAGFEPILVDSPQQIASLDAFRQKATMRANFKFTETPLSEVVAAISKAYGMQLRLDVRALGDAGVSPDTPVTASIEQASPEDLIDTLLHELELTMIEKDELVWITTMDVAGNELSVAVYPVADLVHAGPLKVGAPKQDLSSLSNLITNSIHPATWDEVGGPASIAFHPVTSSLVIAQTRDVHAEISRLLAGIREIRTPLTPEQAKAIEARQKNTAIQSKAYSLPAGLDGKTVVALIMRMDARSWNRGGRTVQLHENQVIVTHSSEMHRRIAELLGEGGSLPLRFSGTGASGGMGGGMM